MQRTIDVFMFQLSIGGHDLVDVANLKWEDIRDNRIIFKRYKNRNKPQGGKTVDNMLNRFALDVIGKYGDKKSKNIFSFLGNPKDGKYTHRLTFATLKRISEALNISPAFSTKSPRYIFRTIAGELLVHDLIIETIQGHTSDRISRKYQRAISYDVHPTPNHCSKPS